MEMQKMGALVKGSGFVFEKVEVETTIKVLGALRNFMSVDDKGAARPEEQIKSLQEAGVLNGKDAEKALKTIKDQASEAKGIITDPIEVEKIVGEVPEWKDADAEENQNKLKRSILSRRSDARNAIKILEVLISEDVQV